MAGKAVIIISAALVLAQVAQVSQAVGCCHPGQRNNLEALCKDKKVPLASRSDFEAIMKEKEDEPVPKSCSQDTLNVLEEFKQILGEPNDNVCDIEKILNLNSLCKKFPEMYPEGTENSEEIKLPELPKSLRRFVIAYGMQVNYLCGKKMIEVLNSVDLMNEFQDDLEKITEVINDQFDFHKFFELTKGPVEFLLVISDALLYQRAEIIKKIQPKNDENYILFKKLCVRQFSIVFENVVVPMINLAYIGFKYSKSFLANNISINLIKWAKAMFLCELYTTVEGEQNLIAWNDIYPETEMIQEEWRQFDPEDQKWFQAQSRVDRIRSKIRFRVSILNAIYDTTDTEFWERVRNFKQDFSRGFLIVRLAKRVLQHLTSKPLELFSIVASDSFS